MKKLLLVAAACLMTTSAFADGYYRHPPYYYNHNHYHYNDNGAAIGLGIIGGIIVGGMIANSHPRTRADECWYEYFYDADGYRHRRLVCSGDFD